MIAVASQEIEGEDLSRMFRVRQGAKDSLSLAGRMVPTAYTVNARVNDQPETQTARVEGAEFARSGRPLGEGQTVVEVFEVGFESEDVTLEGLRREGPVGSRGERC